MKNQNIYISEKQNISVLKVLEILSERHNKRIDNKEDFNESENKLYYSLIAFINSL